MAIEGDGTVAAAERTGAAGGGRHRLPRTGKAADLGNESVAAPCEHGEIHAAEGAAASDTSAATGGRATRAIAFGVLPALLVILGGGAGFLTWTTISLNFLRQARAESVRAATDGAAALLTYHADSVDSDLRAARERLTGTFKTSYTAYTHGVVIPDAHRKHVSAVATVPAAASVWATPDRAVVMVFVNQTFNSDFDPPTGTASSVRVTLAKVSGPWLISDFTPV